MLIHSTIDDLRTGVIALPEFLAQVERQYNEREPSIHALVEETNRFGRLHAEAEDIMRRYPEQASRPGLFGALVGVKDIFRVEGFPTQAGSRLPVDLFQGREADCVTCLKDAGALILGKTVTTEFAYFAPGPTRNPHNPGHTPGGSSSGSAAAVAAGFCQVALGTQTIGSLVRPASFCGVVGLKPTSDRISRAGVIPLSPSLDHVGFFAPDVETAIRVAPVLYEHWDEPTLPLRKPRLGVPAGPYLDRTSEEGRAHFEKVCGLLEQAGYTVQSVPLFSDDSEIQARHHLILSAEAAQVHEQWFGKYASLYSAKLSELIQRGREVSAAQLQAALDARDQFRADMRRIFLDHNLDLWICPATVGAAPMGLESTGDPVMNLPWTQAGLPTLNLPAEKNREGLPLGLQLVGNWYKDESLLFWARDLEKVLSKQ